MLSWGFSTPADGFPWSVFHSFKIASKNTRVIVLGVHRYCTVATTLLYWGYNNYFISH